MDENCCATQAMPSCKYTPHADATKKRENNFVYHKPTEDQQGRYVQLRNYAKSFAALLDHTCPPSRELSLAMTKLEEVVFWANAAIARNEKE